MENLTYNSIILQLEGLKVSEEFVYPVFLFFLIFYIIVMVMNCGMVILIAGQRSLHEPMYLLFCNLTFNDIFGNSITVPRLLLDLLRLPSERIISYAECAVQAFSTHTYATTSHTILMIGLTLRLNRCRTFVSNPFCDNASMFKLSCEDVSINNLYGLIFTVLLMVSSMGSVALTYIKITAVCLTTKSKTLNSRAIKTCSTHLTVYLIMLLSGFAIVILHRFPAYSDYRKLAALLFHIIPSTLNPVIYGLQCTELRHALIQILCIKKINQRKMFPN
nr:olfactory receptor 1496 [Misgurnus anguillicaudatus]